MQSAATAYPVFYRTYSRKINGVREHWDEVCLRTLKGLQSIGNLTEDQASLIDEAQKSLKALTSGRWLWVGGTDWSNKPENYYGSYNCSSTNIVDWHSFGLMMGLAMQGCGTGAVLEPQYIEQLPVIVNRFEVTIKGNVGDKPADQRLQQTRTTIDYPWNDVLIEVGDSREGWVKSYEDFLKLSSDAKFDPEYVVHVTVDLSNVRPSGEALKGFGGVANPVKLESLYTRCAEILSKAVGRKLNSVECCLLIDEAALVVVAGNIRRSAGMRQFSENDTLGMTAKDNLWQQNAVTGKWQIDPERDALRMANHTRVFHHKPSLDECIASVTKQYFSGEGAIQYAPEAVARANADLLPIDSDAKTQFLKAYEDGIEAAKKWLVSQFPSLTERELEHRFQRYGLNPCGEIIGSNFFCNLAEIHLNQISPTDFVDQEKAFMAGALSVSVLLNHQFVDQRYKESREADPIVGVSITGLFDFFVNAFGVNWLQWWADGRCDWYLKWSEFVAICPDNQILTQFDIDLESYRCMIDDRVFYSCSQLYRDLERHYLSYWRMITFETVAGYCEHHGLKTPSRCTTGQPAGCLTKDAIRVFDQGLFFADEHMALGEGECDLREHSLSVRDGVTVSTGIANQELSLVRITLENGRQLTMTPNHRLSIGGQWVAAANMTVGQEIDFEIGNYRKADEASLIHVDVPTGMIGRSRRGCLLPSEMSPQLAYFIGAVFGNGCFSGKYRIRFSHGTISVLKRLSAIGLDLFGLEGCLTEDSRGGKYELSFANKQLYLWFLENGLDKPCKSKALDRIPLKLRQSSRRSILAFFAGLIDTDGCIRNKGSLSIDSSSELFVRHLQQVGEAVGLSFSVFANTQGTNFQDVKEMYGIGLSRMLSDTESVAIINQYSVKAKSRPIQPSKRVFDFHPYRIAKIETGIVDHTFDYAIDGQDDDDSWYWQGGLKSHNTKSLLTGASPGWHPPKAQRFIRRITFRKNDPVALACIDYGYNVIPSQSDKDENGHLLDDPFDPRCTEWLVEIPVEVPWANLDGADKIDISRFSALAQFDFYMQVQKYYTSHNCFSRDTEFLTDKGIKTFNDYEVGDIVTVLNSDGNWVPATVVNTGSAQQMLAITIREGKTGKEKTIISTHCHRFPTRRKSNGNSIVKISKAKDLEVGDRLVLNLANPLSLNKDGIRHGIVFGDGSLYKNKKGVYQGAQLYLCGAKRHLQSYFESFERSYERDDIDQTRIYGLPIEWKSLPDPSADQSYIAGFITGLLATDGNITKSVISICTSKQEVVDFLIDQAPRIGLKVSGCKAFESDGYKKGSKAFQLRFSKTAYPSNMVIRPHHLDHYLAHKSQPCQWRVVNISEAPPQVGWCVMEPKTNHFTLSENILVMNTSSTIELRQHEIEALAKRIYNAIQNDEGYISSALLARFDDLQTFPRLPFEPIDKRTYDRLFAEMLLRRKELDFHEALMKYDDGGNIVEAGPAGCDSDKCLISGSK